LKIRQAYGLKKEKKMERLSRKICFDNQYNYRLEFKAIVFSIEEQESLRRNIIRMNVDSKKDVI